MKYIEELMRTILISACTLILIFASAKAQMTFNDLGSYCEAASQVSTPTLVMRSQGLARSQAEAMMAGMTDPVAIRMVKEVIAFAYSRPADENIEQLRTELRNLCLARKIFVQ